MIRNYLKIALRNLSRYKGISFINVFGLTIGLTCCLLILSYILNEKSYDRFNPQADKIYRVTRSFNTPNGVQTLQLASIAPPFARMLKNDFQEIEDVTQVLPNGSSTFKFGDKIFDEKEDYYADQDFFRFFPVEVLQGNPNTALAEPYSVMMTRAMARKYFGDEDPMNKIIRQDRQFNLKVTGIFKPFPSNAHFHPEILISFNTLKDSAVYGAQQLLTNFGNNAFFTYIKLPENYPTARMERQFPTFLDKNVHFPNQPPGFKGSTGSKLHLQKLTDIHLTSHMDDEFEENGDATRVTIFSIIALFMLLIACINYMNLSTARSVLRAKEIGVRKAVGAQRKEIIMQFLGESILVTCIALVLAMALTALLLPYLARLSGQALVFGSLLRWQVFVPILLLPFVVGLLSGIYPALFMSAFKSSQVLKGIVSVGKSSVSFRKVLVVTQFTISIVLIIATTIVFQQLRFLNTAALGYDRDHIVTVPYNVALDPSYEAFRNDLLKDSGIKLVGRSSRIPTGRLLDTNPVLVPNGDSLQPANFDLKYITVDYDFMPTYGITMAAGRNFSKDFPTDTNAFVLNEATLPHLPWKTPQEALGQMISYGGTKGQVIGVVKDFHFESMHQKIIPLLFRIPASRRNFYGNLSMKVSGEHLPATLAYMEKTWQHYLPETPFTYTFLDENYEKLYRSEQKQGAIFSIFSCIAIFIACLGLFGLSAFTITQRVKEIGIRKILGASIASVVQLLSKDFLKLVLIASVVAFVIAWYSMNRWLTDFAYHISISPWVFIAAGLIACLIAMATIAWQALRAARANPARSLRSE